MPAVTEQASLWTAIRILAEGSDWKRDSAETLEQWAVRRIKNPTDGQDTAREESREEGDAGVTQQYATPAHRLGAMTTEEARARKKVLAEHPSAFAHHFYLIGEWVIWRDKSKDYSLSPSAPTEAAAWIAAAERL